MFCTNCGKQIIDTAKFCNYCGAVVVANMNNAAQPIAVPVNQPSEPVQTAQAVEAEAEAVQAVPVEAVEEVKAEPVAAENTSVTAQPAVGMAVPQAVDSPKEGVAPVVQTAQPVQPVQPMQTATAPNTPMPAAQTTQPVPKPTPKVEREPRMYTAGHIIMCLVSTAIMAIAAGIFAGLYFSVV